MRINQEWVDLLQLGDKVAMHVPRFSDRVYAIATITKITPKRRISTSNGKTFKPDGLEYGKGGTWNNGTRLEPVTEKIQDIIERSHLLANIKNAE